MANSRTSRRKPDIGNADITAKQLLVLREFCRYFDAEQCSPALSDLGKTFKVSAVTISRYLRRLTMHGCLKCTPARYRTWVPTTRGRRLAATVPKSKLRRTSIAA